MYGLSIGVSSIDETLPRPVYALLSGLNAATVGIIALAAVELSEKAITDRITRIVVFISAAAGMMYNALWYFPVLMLASGVATLVFDFRWLHRPVEAIIHAFDWVKKIKPSRSSPPTARRPSVEDPEPTATTTANDRGVELQNRHAHLQPQPELPVSGQEAEAAKTSGSTASTAENEPRVVPREMQLNFSWKAGTVIIVSFFLSFIVAMVLRSVLPSPAPLLYRLVWFSTPV